MVHGSTSGVEGIQSRSRVPIEEPPHYTIPGDGSEDDEWNVEENNAENKDSGDADLDLPPMEDPRLHSDAPLYPLMDEAL